MIVCVIPMTFDLGVITMSITLHAEKQVMV